MNKNEKGFGAVEVLLVIVVVGLIVALGWLFFTRQNNTNSNDQTQANNTKKDQNTPTLQPEEVTEKIKNGWQSKYTLLNIDQNNQPKSGELSIRLTKSAPAYKVDGFNFYTDYDGGSTLGAMPHDPNPTDYTAPKAADTALRNEIAGIYKEFGLAKTEPRGDKATNTETDIYTGKGLICTIEAPTAATSSNRASCGLIKAYKAAADKTKPLADVIPNVNSSTVLSNLKIADSPVNGYKRATLKMGSTNGAGGSVALLYKKDSGSWTYFSNAQQALPCSAYNTTDLKNAFKGESCYGANGQTATVQ